MSAAYQKYKSTEFEWLGNIPEHWEVIRIKDYTYLKARIGWQGLRSDEFIDNTNWYCVTGTDFLDGKINWDNCYCIPKERFDQDTKIQLKINDLLITKDGTIGKVALIEYLPKPTTLNSGVFVSRPLRKKYINKYMFWLLSSSVFTKFIDYNKNGSTILHLYQNVFERFFYSVPSIKEQIQIANYLDAKTQAIDKKIDLLSQKVAYYKELRKTIINEAATKGLDKNVELKESGVEWINKVPIHWSIIRGKCLFVEISKKGYPNQPLLAASQKLGVVLKTMLESRSMEAQKDFENFKLVKENDFVISLRSFEGGIETAYYQGIISPIYTVFTFRYENDVNYFKHIFKSSTFISILKTLVTGIRDGQSIKFVEIQNIFFPVPPPEEQREIANYLDKKTNTIDAVVKNIEKQIDVLKELRKTLINDVVTGKVKVTTNQ